MSHGLRKAFKIFNYNKCCGRATNQTMVIIDMTGQKPKNYAQRLTEALPPQANVCPFNAPLKNLMTFKHILVFVFSLKNCLGSFFALQLFLILYQLRTKTTYETFANCVLV